MARFMSIDPGARVTGLVVWAEGQPVAWAALRCPKKMVVEERVGSMVGGVLAFGVSHRVAAMACEKPF